MSGLEVARCPLHDVASNGADFGEKKAKECQIALKTALPQMRWPKPNGHHPHPPRTAPPTRAAAPTSRTKAPPNKPFNRKTIELKVLEALRVSPNQTASALARSVGGAHTTVARELKELASRGEIAKGADGLWRLTGEKPDPTPALSSN